MTDKGGAVTELPDWVPSAVAPAFGVAARLRGSRALHPKGHARIGRARLTEPGSTLAGGREEVEAVVRLSRGVGLPDHLPDVAGLAVRLVDADGPGRHVDLLLAGSLRSLPWALVPSRDFGCTFSSVAPFRFGGRTVHLLGSVEPGRLRFDQVAGAGPLTVRLWAGGDLLAEIVLVDPTDQSVRFRPLQTGSALQPVGFLHALRPEVYAASRSGSS